jgi:hypothetical protein
MKTAKQFVVVSAAFILAVVTFSVVAPKAAHAVIATLVQVSNTAANPVPTVATDNPASQPFQTRVFPSANQFVSFQVPAGKRLVITDIQAFAFGNSSTLTDLELFSSTQGGSAGLLLPFGTNRNGLLFAGRQVTVFADPGTTVFVGVDDTNSQDNAGINVDIHGYYVNVQ